jgi:ArsR family transcriptional regulator
MTMERRALHSRERYEARAAVAKALAHPTRLLLLDALGEGELCVCELNQLVTADQSTVSKHLAILKQAGLVAERKEGPKTFYRPTVCCLKGVWECIESVLKENLRAQRAAISG